MSKLDTIDVIHIENVSEEGKTYDYICLVLNDEIVKGTFDSYLFMCSGALKRGRLELLTCTCGVGGCAGIFDGTDVKRRRYTVEWRDIDCGFPKKFYSFDTKAYDAAIEKAHQLMLHVATKREKAGLTEDDESYYDSILSFWTVKELQENIQWTKRYIVEYYSR